MGRDSCNYSLSWYPNYFGLVGGAGNSLLYSLALHRILEGGPARRKYLDEFREQRDSTQKKLSAKNKQSSEKPLLSFAEIRKSLEKSDEPVAQLLLSQGKETSVVPMDIPRRMGDLQALSGEEITCC